MERFETEEFILAVQAREPIWLATHPKHKHKKTVNKMWNEISEQFPEMSKLALKKKWKNLRDSFKRELKKNPESHSRWSYFDLMKFISSYELQTTTSTVKTEEIPLIEMSTQTHVRYTTVDSIENMVQTNNAEVNEVNIGVGVGVGVGVDVDVDADATATLSISNDNNNTMHNIKQRKRKIRQDELSVVYETTVPTKVVKANELEMLIDHPEQHHHHHHQQHQPQHQQHQPQHQQQQQQAQQHQIEDSINTISSANMVEFMVEKNDDYHFFMSLLPQMSKFETLQKLRIRQHIQQIIIDEACMLQNGYTNA